MTLTSISLPLRLPVLLNTPKHFFFLRHSQYQHHLHSLSCICSPSSPLKQLHRPGNTFMHNHPTQLYHPAQNTVLSALTITPNSTTAPLEPIYYTTHPPHIPYGSLRLPPANHRAPSSPTYNTQPTTHSLPLLWGWTNRDGVGGHRLMFFLIINY